MAYQIVFKPSAEKELAALPEEARERIIVKAHSLADNPRPPGVKKLKGRIELYRVRVGEYRIVYEILDDRLIVYVLQVGHRKDVYR